ncbi:PAS domain-containing protein [Cetobacterium sp.]|uniref:PAS domain-containing protein n=2 Tax=cellular organisms TaxID=131567 RepID=UPI003EE45FC4
MDLLFFKDEKLKYKYLNTSFAKLFTKEREEVYGKTDKELLPEELYYQCYKGDIETIDYIYENKIDTYYLILIDLDNLRSLNNNPEGIFFRIGGDEFSGLINRSKTEVEEILKKIYGDLIKIGLSPQLSISTGAKNLDISKNYLENYANTDKLLYEAKLKGKGCYILK